MSVGVLPPKAVATIRSPSGDQPLGARSRDPAATLRGGWVPATGAVQMAMVPPSRAEPKARDWPSGDQCGVWSAAASNVKRERSPRRTS